MKTKVISVLTMVYGGGTAVFGLFFIAIIFLQKLMFSTMPSSVNFVNQRLYMETLHNIWLVFMPMLIVLGFLFVLSGYCLYNARDVGKRLAQGSSIAVILWFAFYALILEVKAGAMMENTFFLNNFLYVPFVVFSYLMSFVMLCGYPVFLLFYLPRISRTTEPSLRQGASGP
jgi:hypothetical protein